MPFDYPLDFQKEHFIFKFFRGGDLGKIKDTFKNYNKNKITMLVTTKASDGSTPLLLAAGLGHLKIMRWLCNNGVSLEEKDNDGQTALLKAAYNGQIKIIQWLHQNGVSLKERDKYGRTALLCAARAGQIGTIQWLLQNGASLKEKDNYGKTALMSASRAGQIGTIQWLLQNGVSLKEKDNDGTTALMCAAYTGQIGTIQWLLQNGASLKDKDKEGRTALLHAIKKEHPDVVKFLLKQPNLSYQDILSARKYTMDNEYGNETIKKLIQEHVDWVDELIEEENIDIPHEYVCPITQELISIPVRIPGDTKPERIYEKEAIETWLENHGTCPMTRRIITDRELSPCIEKQKEINKKIEEIEQIRGKHIKLAQDRSAVSSMMFKPPHLHKVTGNTNTYEDLNLLVQDYVGDSFFKI